MEEIETFCKLCERAFASLPKRTPKTLKGRCRGKTALQNADTGKGLAGTSPSGRVARRAEGQ